MGKGGEGKGGGRRASKVWGCPGATKGRSVGSAYMEIVQRDDGRHEGERANGV